MRLSAAALAIFFTGSLALAQTTPASLKLQPDKFNPAIPLPYDKNNNPIYAACLVSLRVNKDGNPENIHIGICADNRIQAYVAASAAQFKFVPAMKNGKTVSSDITFAAMPHYPSENHTEDSTPINPGDAKDLFTSGRVKLPILVYAPEAAYPESAGDKKQSGTVDVGVIVTKYGTVQNPQIEKSSDSDFNQSALNTVQTYLFKPGIMDDKPVAVRIVIEVGFSIR